MILRFILIAVSLYFGIMSIAKHKKRETYSLISEVILVFVVFLLSNPVYGIDNFVYAFAMLSKVMDILAIILFTLFYVNVVMVRKNEAEKAKNVTLTIPTENISLRTQKLAEYKRMFDAGLINEEEYSKLKTKVLEEYLK